MASTPGRTPPKDRADWTLGELLGWHFRRGTRPRGSPDKPGDQWTPKSFATKIGVTDHSVRNWRNDSNLPSDEQFAWIEIGLFGDNTAPQYLEWKQELRDKRGQAQQGKRSSAEDSDSAMLSPATAPSSLPTKPPRCFGRDNDLKAVVEALIPNQVSAAILVLGGPGMGKTTLTREAANAHAAIDRFGNRRWFVELETAIDTQTFEIAIVSALGLDSAAAKFDAALAVLGRAPGLLVLDNLETPWDGERERAEALLSRLHRVDGLTILASIRGNEPPGGLRWTRQRTMHPLKWPHDRDLFLDIAQKIKADDPQLEPLLKELGGIPLAIELMAQQAAAHDTASAILDEWRRIGGALAKRPGVEPSRLTSLDISLELSFNSQRLGDAGRRLFSILGQLPAGVGAEDLRALLGDSAFDSRHGLLACGLAFERDGRLDLLPPVRDHARRFHLPVDSDAALLRNHFLALARDHSDRIGTAEGAGSVQRLAAEVPNLDAAQRAALAIGDLKAALAAARGIALVMRYRGLGSSSTIRELVVACRATGNILGEANCIWSLGDIALARSDHDAARHAYEQALPLYRQVGQILGEANCIASLGDIALARSDHDAARQAYEQALPLYRQVGQILGEANCIWSLGDIALARSDHDAARDKYLEALSLYERIAEPYSIGRAHRRLAALTDGETRDRHLAAARAAWTSIDRADLVATLE